MSQKVSVILKTRYYLDHFNEMIGFVLRHYQHALEPAHREFLDAFHALSLDARCLFVRFVNRKGAVFYREYLRYEEIEDLDSTIAELSERRFLRPPGPGDYADLLALQTRPTLVDLIRREVPDTNVIRPTAAKKRELVEFTLSQLAFERCFPESELLRYVVQGRCEEVDYLLYLYFGKLRHGLTSFALRDLGVVRTGGFRSEFEARFPSRETALASYHYDRILAQLERATPALLDRWAEEASRWPAIEHAEIETRRARALHYLGRKLERSGRGTDALKVYRLSDRFPSTERSVRLLMADGRREEAEQMLQDMIDNPSCDEELLFAEDFYARKFEKRKLARLTAMLREARILPLDETGRDYPELSAAGAFQRHGWEAWHTENLIWQQLFGLLFWDQLFGQTEAALYNEFDSRPAGLDSGIFYETHREAIGEALRILDDPPRAAARLQTIWDAHSDTPNGLVPWHPDVFNLVLKLVELAPPGALRKVLGEMAANHKANRSGFPDLMLVRNGELKFVEIKAEGDQIQRHQLMQLERLRNAGVAVEVVRVEWTVDPGQEYVVVDLETTGGSSQWNRITEIGAVKIRGETVIGEWSTLVNPGRKIPKDIVRLTGITDEMVAGAPRFEEVADEFRAFLGDAVFAAHRAKFDYGFLRAEYQRLGQDFRGPVICTVVAMRRHFPGLPSYSLANLCSTFDVSLDRHHRALCDARATAQLLVKINEKRRDRAVKAS